MAVTAYGVAFGYFLFDAFPFNSACHVGNCECFVVWVAVIPVDTDNVVFCYNHLTVDAVTALDFKCS